MPFWTKEREAGVWDFKEEAGNLQVDRKSYHVINKFLGAHPETMGHRGKQALLELSLSATFSLYYDA